MWAQNTAAPHPASATSQHSHLTSRIPSTQGASPFTSSAAPVMRKVDARLPGKGNSNSHGARPVHLIITMIKWIRTSRLSMLSLSRDSRGRGELCHVLLQLPLHATFTSVAPKPETPRPPIQWAGYIGGCDQEEGMIECPFRQPLATQSQEGCSEWPQGASPRTPSAAPARRIHFSDKTQGGVPREQKMLKGHLPRVIYHQVY